MMHYLFHFRIPKTYSISSHKLSCWYHHVCCRSALFHGRNYR